MASAASIIVHELELRVRNKTASGKDPARTIRLLLLQASDPKVY
jgi:hypothetical protein